MSSVQTNLQSMGSIMVSLFTAIGSISFLEASGIVIGIIFTIAIGVSTIKRNSAQTRQSEIIIKKLEKEMIGNNHKLTKPGPE